MSSFFFFVCDSQQSHSTEHCFIITIIIPYVYLYSRFMELCKRLAQWCSSLIFVLARDALKHRNLLRVSTADGRKLFSLSPRLIPFLVFLVLCPSQWLFNMYLKKHYIWACPTLTRHSACKLVCSITFAGDDF